MVCIIILTITNNNKINIYTNKAPLSNRTYTSNTKNNSVPSQRNNIHKILVFIHPIHNHNRRNTSTIYI